jgi:predicted Fe-Mo cluster-binding NifX family protein
MKIAITVWGSRISPVFDAATALLLVEIAGNDVIERDIRLCQPSRHDRFVALLKDNDVKLLICGAICEPAVKRLEAEGLEVVPFLAGEVEQLIESCFSEQDFTEFAMPGCRHGRCCRGKYKGVESQD